MQYTIRGVEVDFPYNAYECQLIYMEKVIQSLQERRNALLESPTGTGKTLCLLCAALAWRKSFMQRKHQNSQDSQESPAVIVTPKIIYSSRTHTQLTQVIKELKATSYRPKMCILGSRSQMCIHPTVSSMKGRQLDYACRALVSQHRCSYYESVTEHKNNSEFNNQVCDIEDMATLGRQHGACPYYLSRELQVAADIVFMPYNYLIDPDIRKSLNVNLEDAIIIFDEAHNLEGVCADAASFDFGAGELAACVRETQQAIDLIANNGYSGEIDREELARLKTLFLSLETKIDGLKLEKDGYTQRGSYIYELFGDLGINFETKSLLIKLIDITVNLLHDEASAGHRQTLSLELFNSIIKTIFKVPMSEDHPSQFYKVHIHTEKAKPHIRDGLFSGKQNKPGQGRTLSYWCFNPGVAMEDLQLAGVRSIILTSGTLSPLDSFAYELKTQFHIRLENPHVISGSQVWVGVVCSGPSGQPLDSSYNNRDNVEYKTNLGNAIVNYARIVPDGILVFFPSYSTLSACIDTWKIPSTGSSSTVWERICALKQPVVEPRESYQFSMAIEDFYVKVKESSGAIFFAVCRGKVSEGLDFADRNGRAVIITGLPYPAKEDPKVKLKREFLDECKPVEGVKLLKGNEWYTQQASRAVNQAVGRVIRHRHDYGAIILCDQRFAAKGTKEQLSLWLRPHIQVYNKFGEANVSLTRFFKAHSVPASASNEHNPTKDNPTISFDKLLTRPPTNKLSLLQTIDKANERAFTPSTPVSPPTKVLPPKVLPPKALEKSSLPLSSNSEYNAYQNPKGPDKSTRDIRKFLNPSVITQPVNLPSDADKKRDAKEYLAKVMNGLTPTEYSQFQNNLKSFKKGEIDIDTLVHAVRTLFAVPERVGLLEGFIAFVPKKHQERCRPLLSADSIQNSTPSAPLTPNLSKLQASTPTKRLGYDLISGQPLRACKKPKLNQDVSQQEKGEQISPVTTEVATVNVPAEKAGCPICRGKIEAPFSAKCGHVCCHECWQQWLKEKLECPVCREKTRPKQLTKLYFM